SYDEIVKTLPFTPASRITAADEANDTRSLERKLSNSLFLIVKRNRESHSWQFPQGKWLDGETMRQTAERVNDRTVGEIRRWFVSNSPIGHFCYAYPPAMQEQRKQYGAKVFFYRAQLIEGELKLETRLYKDYAWIARSEVGEYFDPDLAEYMQELLID
ncbi:MRPL46, partial [Symbiodinium microadriaticum]